MELVAEVDVLAADLIENITGDGSFKRLEALDDIDSGEQLLAAVVLRNPIGRFLISGDKRFINALRQSLPDDWKRIGSSVISFEQCLLAIEREFGPDLIIERTTPRRMCDKTLNLALGATFDRLQFIEALQSYDPCKSTTSSGA